MPGLNGLFPGSSLGGGGSTATGLGRRRIHQVEDREERYAVTDIVYKNYGRDELEVRRRYFALAAKRDSAVRGAGRPVRVLEYSDRFHRHVAAGTGGAPFASFLLGVANGNVTLRAAEIPYYYRWNTRRGFVQNDWKVRPNLTLNLGHPLQRADAAHGEVRQPGRVSPGHGAVRPAACAADSAGWEVITQYAGAAVRVLRPRRQFALHDADGLSGFRAAIRLRLEPGALRDAWR